MSLVLNKLFLAGSVFRSNLTAKVISTKFIYFCNESSNKNIRTIKSSKDRTAIIPVETSIRYLQSSAYKETYGDKRIWELYKRNYKGHFQPKKTRIQCIRSGVISTGNPCPICRDEFLVLDYRNIELLKQFFSEHTGEILSYACTGLCQKAHNDLLVAIMKAKNYGTLIYEVPYKYYDFSEWRSKS